MSKGFRRLHLRSPLDSSVLYESEGHVHRAHSVNISEGGILLEYLPFVPEIRSIPLMFSLPQYPVFSRLSFESVKQLNVQSLECKVIRTKARLVRSFEGHSAVDRVFVHKIACEFVTPQAQVSQAISEYVKIFASNLVFLLGLFQRSSQVDHLRLIASNLGYDGQAKLPVLRQNILHDYQSLESL
jgi:hypothetical protein